jgi:hypothetical protein
MAAKIDAWDATQAQKALRRLLQGLFFNMATMRQITRSD